MTSIVLATLNARYTHSSFGLRYLWANMGDLKNDTCMLEFVVQENSVDILAAILEHEPKMVGLGVYIWNVEALTRVVAELKRIRPDIKIILGGPEVSYDAEELPIVQQSDYVISGEADLAFPELCAKLLEGVACPDKFIRPPIPNLDQIVLPYDLYDAKDIATRVLYVEVSRGCPFTCEFCLSSLEIPVRLVNVDRFLDSMQSLLDQGAKQFKFVDRTFNLNLRLGERILQFFLDRYREGMFLHFEMIPDRLPEGLRHLIAKFPPGSLQFEIGVQTFNDEVGQRIHRKQNNAKLEENFRFLRQETGVHIHADLIVGLPGESLQSFAEGFDRLYKLRPQEIQVGILKRLRGTPIVRHDEEWQMIYSPSPPYEILSNRLLTFEQIHRLRRFARFWDLIGNSGNFVETLPLLIRDDRSAFVEFDSLCEDLYEKHGKKHGIALIELFESVFEFLVARQQRESEQTVVCDSSPPSPRLDRDTILHALWKDYTRGGRRDRPSFLRDFKLEPLPITRKQLPARQNRHVQAHPGL